MRHIAARLMLSAALLAVPSFLPAHEGLDAQEADLTRRIEAAPGDASLRLRRGELRRLGGRWREAMADYRAARLLDPGMDAVDLCLGELWLDRGEPSRAIEPLDRFLLRRPDHAGALAARGRAREALGDHLRAAEDFTGAIRAVGPDGAHALPDYYLARVRALAAAGPGHLDEAIRGLEEATARLTRSIPVPLEGVPVASLPGADPAAPIVLTRGPYLQSGSHESVVIRWRTGQPSDSRVWFGSEPGLLTSVVEDPALVTDHEVRVAGLPPATRRFYAVGSSSGVLAGDDADHFFTTSPLPGAAAPARIWVIGDSGTANASARAVRDAWEAFSARRPPADLWLMLGDNAYPDGTDAQYQAAVFDMYPRMLRNTPLWSTLGNHDGHTADSASQSGPYYDIFTLPSAGEAGGIPSGTEAYYSFDYGEIHFVCLESYETDRSPGGAMLKWLEEDLSATTARWIVAFWHHPPYSRGSHDSDREAELIQMRGNALPILERHGVDLVLTGHSHSYERSFLLDGHYGPSGTLTPAMKVDGGDGREEGTGAYRKPPAAGAPHEGAVHVVAGSSGQISGGRLNHPAMYVSLNALGSLVLDVNGRRLDASFLDSGGIVRDHFTMVKKTLHPPRAVAAAPTRSECTSRSGAVVALDGSGSTDQDSAPGGASDIVEHRWYEDYGLAGERLLGTGERLGVTLPLGPHDITLEVADTGGDTGTDSIRVEVVDTTPPVMTLSVRPDLLWPPDGRMVSVEAAATAEDLCGDAVVVLEAIEDGSGDRTPPTGAGRSGPDVSGAEPGTADFRFELRAERAGNEVARTYTLTYRGIDASGNSVTDAARVVVPHDRRLGR